MRVLVLGAGGMVGEHLADALAGHDVRLTDLEATAGPTGHGIEPLDITDAHAVHAAVRGVDAIVNLTVVRDQPELAYRVNACGVHHLMQAAAAHGVRRVIQTGPHLAVCGPEAQAFGVEIGAELPPQPGTGLYGFTKFVGEEIARAFTRAHDVWVQALLFYHLRDANDLQLGLRPPRPFAVSLQDAAHAIRLAVEVPLEMLPSRYEAYFVSADTPHGRFSSEKVRRVLGWRPNDDLTPIWRQP